MQQHGSVEERRLEVLRRFDVLDASPDRAQLDLVRLAALVSGAPATAVALVDADRVWPLAATGFLAQETPRVGSVADEVVRTGAPLVLTDPGRDPRFAHDALVRGLGGRHLVAVPLLADDQTIGALLVAEPQPVGDGEQQVEGLGLVADRVVADLELRRTRIELTLELGARHLQRRTDELTGLHDRRGLYDRASVEFARHRRHGTGILVAVVDLDDFTAFNERRGRATGDALLQRIGRTVEEANRQADLLSRWGGDRFVLVAPDTPVEGVCPLLERIRGVVRDLLVEGEGVTCSIGATVAGPGRDDFQHALQVAEAQLEMVRRAGGDSVRVDLGEAARGAASPA